MTPERINELQAMYESRASDNWVLLLRMGLGDALDEIERLQAVIKNLHSRRRETDRLLEEMEPKK